MNLRNFVKRMLSVTALAALATALCVTTNSEAADKVDVVQAKPLQDVLKDVKLQPVKGGKLRVPTITWPGDVATVYADQEGVFKAEGVDIELFCENDFAKQVQGVLDGETPILRGTMGMINTAAESFSKAGTELVVVYQLTWSSGGDCLVVRPGIKNLSDLKGKTIALQAYGPHVDFLTTTLARAGLKPTDVKLKWMKELTIPTYDTKGRILDPRSAFAASPDIDACFVISPDAAALTSGGTGTGGEGSVKGAKVLFSSKSANRIISDVYAVRKDWYEKNQADVEKFVHALMVGTEQFQAVVADKANNQAKYNKLMKQSAKLLFGSDQATADVEGSLGDCEWVGFQGNVGFFTGNGTTRNFAVLVNEVQTAFLDLTLMTKRVDIQKSAWDYTKLAKGLKNVDLTAVAKPAFDTTKAQQKIENEIATELDKWQDGALYAFEIYFEPNKIDFSAASYQEAFKKAVELSQTFGGTLVIVEGHNSPDAINKAKADGKTPTEVAQIEQAAKNLSYQRSVAVRKAYLEYCKKQGLNVDESQFVAVGVGAKIPKFAVPTTAEEWKSNRRVVFRVKAVETELDSFKPASK